MSRRRSLRRQWLLGLSVYAVLLTVAVTAHGIWVNERAEQSVWESLLAAEADYVRQRQAVDPAFRLPDAGLVRAYDEQSNIPAEFRTLPAGVHDEVALDDRQFVVLVESNSGSRHVLALDITDQEHGELALAGSLVASTLLIVLVLIALASVGITRLLRPLTEVARQIPGLSPDARGDALRIEASAPGEVAVLAESINGFLERTRDYIEREKTFINLASHELRTPVSIASASLELAMARATAETQPLLARALKAVQGMEELTAMLLALARDPDRAVRDLPAENLRDLLPPIVEDHAELAHAKELTLTLEMDDIIDVHAPAQVLTSVVGNLVRNAIEHSGRGHIRIRTRAPATLIVEDNGYGMSAAEMSALASRLARSGAPSVGGIGLGLIARLCEHFGWSLTLDSSPGRGTTATLNFTHSLRSQAERPAISGH